MGPTPFLRPPMYFRRHAPTPQLFVDIPVQSHIQPAIAYRPSAGSLYRPPLSSIASNAVYQPYQRQRVRTMADQDFKMDMMFEDYMDDTENAFDCSKPPAQYPICSQAFPYNFSFRPWPQSDYDHTSLMQQNSPLVPAKIENMPTMPIPAVLSTPVDVSKYQNIQRHEWLEAPTDYTGTSPASPTTFDGSPHSQDIQTFDDHMADHETYQWGAVDYPAPQAEPRLSLPSSSFTEDDSSASPAMSHDAFNQPVGGPSWPTAMFGQPDVVPPSRYHTFGRIQQPTTAAPYEIERPSSQSSNSAPSIVPTMRSRATPPDDEHYIKRRDSMLVDLRRKGHSYKEIKRMGRFREAESTLRGRLRTLTKDKTERVRKPKWNRRDV